MQILTCCVALLLVGCASHKAPTTRSDAPYLPTAGSPVTQVIDRLGQPDVWARNASLRPGGGGYSIGGFIPAGPPPAQGEAVLAYWLDRSKASPSDGKARLVFVKNGRVTGTVEDRLVVGW
jgi:hypothetical protein